MAVMNIEQVSADMPLSPLYIIHGEEDLLRIEALDTLRAAAKKQGYLNREVFTADNGADWDELLQSAGSAGLFADLKLLEIHIPNGKPGKNGGDALQTFAEHLPEDTVSLILLPKLEKAQTQAKWFTALAAKGTVLEAKAISAQALPQWIKGRLKKVGLDIEPDALALFAERVEGNLLAARQEIDKLALLHPQKPYRQHRRCRSRRRQRRPFRRVPAFRRMDERRCPARRPPLGRTRRRRRRTRLAAVGGCRRHPHPHPPDRRAQTRAERAIRPQQPAPVGRQTNPRADCRQTHSHRPPDRSAENLR
ncbi:DNA polymerase III, delta subunit [Neisseria mucosa ATCC 25996]|uniref:DNA polymerase III, delta subunit n=1 Tax=Neisseria mucosa (strain ATCC 25996 / DSM 4631 / NCTC 10774 / M26) TaxID=546266 RepID=D2ZTG9_NEIM2|nr:DNA polymerase III, delta subunit [Neisseria mucosa ATCC 25996]